MKPKMCNEMTNRSRANLSTQSTPPQLSYLPNKIRIIKHKKIKIKKDSLDDKLMMHDKKTLKEYHRLVDGDSWHNLAVRWKKSHTFVNNFELVNLTRRRSQARFCRITWPFQKVKACHFYDETCVQIVFRSENSLKVCKNHSYLLLE